MTYQVSVDYFEEEQSRQRDDFFSRQRWLVVAFSKIVTGLIGKKMVYFAQIQNICGEIRPGDATLEALKSLSSAKWIAHAAWRLGTDVFPYEGPQEDCTASWVVETGFKPAFPPSTLTVITNWLGVRTLSAKSSERPKPVDSILPVFIWRRKDPRPWHWSQ